MRDPEYSLVFDSAQVQPNQVPQVANKVENLAQQTLSTFETVEIQQRGKGSDASWDSVIIQVTPVPKDAAGQDEFEAALKQQPAFEKFLSRPGTLDKLTPDTTDDEDDTDDEDGGGPSAALTPDMSSSDNEEEEEEKVSRGLGLSL